MIEMRELTTGQRAVLIAATLPMIGAGGLGAWGTYTNITAEFGRAATALGVVSAGEGVTLVLALVMVGLTMLGQAAPWPVRVGLWAAPVAAAATGVAVADNGTEAVVYGITPMAMCASAEGLGLLARRIVVYRTGVDIEAQRRNARIMRRIAYHRARAGRHPKDGVRNRSTLISWWLLRRAGEGDAELGADLIGVQRLKLTEGAGLALDDMLAAGPQAHELITAEPHEPTQPVAALDQTPVAESASRLQRAPKQQPPSEPAGPVGEQLEDFASLLGMAHAPVVYFVRNGSRVKIGVTQNLARRMRSISLRPSDVIRVEHGHTTYETLLRDRFRALRVGDTNWFELRGELTEYLGLLDEKAHGLTAGEQGENSRDEPEPEQGEPEPEHEKTALPTQPLTETPAPPADEQQVNGTGASQPQDGREPTAREQQREQEYEREPVPSASTEMRQIIELAAKLQGGQRITKSTAAPLLGVSAATAQRRLTKAHRVVELASRLKAGERLTPATAAPLLGVDEKTAEARLIEARKLNGEGTGFYA
ncbi:GIY-YIG nuclease family protein [Streptomyces sp. NPDC101455]|uniref:GIY-YIG nuclease family protein n=1 Tax=Streptomyces sp. NPDC101455 TaxID=3366142 RepID=UPI00381258E5